ncbi:MAG: amidoligase family protein [Rickettsiales bacterium]|nr:amidoligase family protein [Rickettsiales bacterium]
MSSNYMLHPQKNTSGEPRKVGLELEFLGVSLRSTADCIAREFNGISVCENEHFYTIKSDGLGCFHVELDSGLIHRLCEEKDNRDEDELRGMLSSITHDVVHSAVDEIAPNEVVTPPLNAKELKKFELVVDALRRLGAQGTKSSWAHAFGLHINADVVELSAQHLLAVMQSYCLLHDYIVDGMEVDMTRKVARYAAPYPEMYVQHILQENYQPNMEQLITDYLVHNPTRNRALDMLPIFKLIDEDLIESRLRNQLIKERPAFHFRLPNSRIDEEDWSIASELAWWQDIEFLASHDALRKQMARAYIESAQNPWWHLDQSAWRKEVGQWLPQ